MAYFSPFLLCKRLHLFPCKLHKNRIKSAHFPQKYGKCADFMQLALCFKFNMVLRRIAKRKTYLEEANFTFVNLATLPGR